MSKLKEWHFFDKVYRIWVVVFIGSRKDFVEMMRGLEYAEIDELETFANQAQALHMRITPDMNKLKADYSVMYFPKITDDNLIHELSHLVIRTFHDKGIDITLDTTEPFSFYLEHWFHEIKQAIKTRPKGISAAEVTRKNML